MYRLHIQGRLKTTVHIFTAVKNLSLTNDSAVCMQLVINTNIVAPHLCLVCVISYHQSRLVLLEYYGSEVQYTVGPSIVHMIYLFYS
jgi:hypothetical protein